MKTRRLELPAILLISLFSMVLMFLMTPNGAGLSPDSMAYIRAANALLVEKSFASLPSHWPPGYPLALTLAAVPLGDVFVAARFLCALILGLNMALFCVLLWRAGLNAWIALLMSLIFVLDPSFLLIHVMAWSEPAFLLCLQAGLLAMLMHSRDARSNRMIVSAGVAFGLASLVRYAGLAFVGGVAAWLLWRAIAQRKDAAPGTSFKQLGMFCGVSPAPLLLSAIVRSLSQSQDSIRRFVFHEIQPATWQQGLNTVVGWFGGAGMELVLLVFIPVALFTGRRALGAPIKSFVWLIAVLFCSYVAFLWMSLSFFDAYIPLDMRILSPAKLLVFLAIACAVLALPIRWQALAAAIFLAALLLLNSSETRRISAASSQGLGFANKVYASLPIISFAKANRLAIAATNMPELLTLYLGKEVPLVPKTYDPGTTLTNARLTENLQQLGSSRSVVMLFSMAGRNYLASPSQFMEAGFTRVLYDAEDGVIMEHP